jgi:hypothetical protein
MNDDDELPENWEALDSHNCAPRAGWLLSIVLLSGKI